MALASREYRQIPVDGIVGLDAPENTTQTLIRVEGAGVRWRDDGTDPTSTVGMPVDDGETLVYDSNLDELRFAAVAAGAILNCVFYGPRGAERDG